MNDFYIYSLLPHILISKVQNHDSNHVSAYPDVHLSKFGYNQNQNLKFSKDMNEINISCFLFKLLAKQA